MATWPKSWCDCQHPDIFPFNVHFDSVIVFCHRGSDVFSSRIFVVEKWCLCYNKPCSHAHSDSNTYNVYPSPLQHSQRYCVFFVHTSPVYPVYSEHWEDLAMSESVEEKSHEEENNKQVSPEPTVTTVERLSFSLKKKEKVHINTLAAMKHYTLSIQSLNSFIKEQFQ